MPSKGGSATTAGISYQLWFTTTKFAEAFFDEGMIVQPEATLSKTADNQEGGSVSFTEKVASIDDLMIEHDRNLTFYNLKYIAPNHSTWSVSALLRENVLQDFLDQHIRTPNAHLVFVSQSPCPFLRVCEDVSEASSQEDLRLRLGSESKRKDWHKVLKALKLSEKKLLELAKLLRFELCLSHNDMRQRIQQMYFGHVTNEGFVPDVLYACATETAIYRKRVSQNHVIGLFQRKNIQVKSHLADKDVVGLFSSVSSVLAEWKNDFGRLASSHIQRKEVDNVLKWIDKPLEEGNDPLLLLVGGAGCGKTVILRDALNSLQQNGTPCLALKADIQFGKTLEELTSTLSLPDRIEKLLGTLSESHEKVVVMIDQIDALSQSLSADHRALNSYFELIRRLSRIPHIRIVVSCREFDLNFDPLLKQFEKKQVQRVELLTDIELDSILVRLGIDSKSILSGLRTLLRTPIHLDIFCSIFSSSLRLVSLNSLQDLYTELWRQKILSNQVQEGSQALTDLLTTIASEIYASQKLSVPVDQFHDKWSREMTYLQSEGIVIAHGKLVQFLHQSFFDYVFARSFVSSGKSLTKEIHSQHQGLFIRSQVKQVLAYLRATDQQVYSAEVAKILRSTKTRFHIKLLIVNQLGFEENPISQEWQIVCETVLRHKVLRNRFLESVRAENWLHLLVQNNILQQYACSKDETIRRSCTWMLSVLCKTSQNSVLRFLKELPTDQDQIQIVKDVLLELIDWREPVAIELFEEVKNQFHGNQHWGLSQILQNAVETNPKWVAKALAEQVDANIQATRSGFRPGERYVYFDKNLNQVYEKLFVKEPKIFFWMTLPLLKRLVEKRRFGEGDVYFRDWEFMHFPQLGHLYEHEGVFDKVKKYVHKLAEQDSAAFLDAISEIESSFSLTLLNLVVSTYSLYPAKYKNQALRLLTREGFLKEFNHHDYFGFETLTLLRNVYPYLTETQQQYLNTHILMAEPNWEKKKNWRNRRGENRLRLLSAVTENQLINHPEARKLLQELERKHGKFNLVAPQGFGISGVGPPLPIAAYKKMKFQDWLNSFREYDESTGRERRRKFENKRGFHFGGLVENARVFQAEVKENPERFYPFLIQLLDEKVDPSYVAYGLIGLVEAGFDPIQVRVLAKCIAINYSEKEVRRFVIQAFEYLDRRDAIDDDIVSILGDWAKTDSDPEKEYWNPDATGGIAYHGGDPLGTGINSVRGAATWRLSLIGKRPQFTQRVFDFLDEIALDKSIAVRSCVVVHLAQFIRVDKQRTLKILLAATNDLEPHIVTHSLQCISYLMRDSFGKFTPHFKVAMRVKEKVAYESVQHAVGQVLMLAYVEGKRGSKELLERAFRLSDDAKAGAIDFSARHLLYPKPIIRHRSKDVFHRFLKNKSEPVGSEYDKCFSQFAEKDFAKLYDSVIACARSVTPQQGIGSHWFFEYLTKCVSDNPTGCLELLRVYLKKEKNTDPFYGDEPMKILVGAYSRLQEFQKSNKTLEKAMNIFDRMLQSEQFRGHAQSVLRSADYV